MFNGVEEGLADPYRCNDFSGTTQLPLVRLFSDISSTGHKSDRSSLLLSGLTASQLLSLDMGRDTKLASFLLVGLATRHCITRPKDCIFMIQGNLI